MSAILQEEVHSVSGMTLLVKKLQNGQRLTVVVEVITGSDCILHWGLSRRRRRSAPPSGRLLA